MFFENKLAFILKMTLGPQGQIRELGNPASLMAGIPQSSSLPSFTSSTPDIPQIGIPQIGTIRIGDTIQPDIPPSDPVEKAIQEHFGSTELTIHEQLQQDLKLN